MDTIEIKAQVSLIFLEDSIDADHELAAMFLNHISVHLPVDIHEWDRMGEDDRNNLVQDILWERCRVVWVEVKK
jgi:hypothetical protein